MKKGGYIIIDLTSTTLVDDLSKALGFGKPVLVYNANNEANFYTLSYDDDNDLYILNGAKDSFSVDDDGDITPISTENKLYHHRMAIAFNHTFGETSRRINVSAMLLSRESEKYTTTNMPTNTSIDMSLVVIGPIATTTLVCYSASLTFGTTNIIFNLIFNDGTDTYYVNDSVAYTDLVSFGDNVTEF